MSKQDAIEAAQRWLKQKETDPVIQKAWKEIQESNAKFREASKLAQRSGKIAGQVLSDAVVNGSVDGRMSAEDAAELLRPTMKANYEFVADAAEQAVINANRDAGIRLKGVKPEFNSDRVDGIATEIGNAEDVRNLAGRITSQVENASMSVVDDAVRDNADFMYKSGRNPKIVRSGSSNCCPWCAALIGSYDYASVRGAGNDVYRRHENCNCVVEYDPGTKDGHRENVHTKRIVSRDEVERRKETTSTSKRDIIRPEQRIKQYEEHNPFRLARFRTGDMTSEEYAEYRRELENVKTTEEIRLSPAEYSRVMRVFNTDLSDEERKHAIIVHPVDQYYYKAINYGYDNYRFIERIDIVKSVNDYLDRER